MAAYKTYKLIYFNLRGRGEVARLLFAAAGVKYEDFRIERSSWDEWKPKINPPFDKVPLLEVNGQTICQSHAIERYLAKKFDLAGKTDWEQAKCDMVVDCIEEIVVDLVKIRKQEDADKKKEMISTYLVQMERAMDNLTTILKSNNGGQGFFVGDGLTFADLCFLHYPLHIECSIKQPLEWSKWPVLAAHRTRVGNIDRIAEWIKNRPVTPM